MLDFSVDRIQFHIADKDGVPVTGDWSFRDQSNRRGVYLFADSLGSKIKFSIHRRGYANDGLDTQFGVEKLYKEELLKNNPNLPKTFYRYKRKELTSSNPSRLLAKIYFPARLLETKSEHKGRGVKICHGGTGTAVWVMLFNVLPLDRKQSQMYERMGFRHLATCFLEDEEVHLVTMLIPDSISLPINLRASSWWMSDEKAEELNVNQLAYLGFNDPSHNGILELFVGNKVRFSGM